MEQEVEGGRVLHTVSSCQSAISSLSARLVTLMEADVCVQTHVGWEEEESDVHGRVLTQETWE
ncbi:hypothetical protein F7725_008299 [Dissostichus mawsoni]|uniref:Uncharacterized protein n=1 Tax=Dissostichus mawsoni TaxID=36200 RepID=A0A7J5Y6R3_DISMA|nr:hypothetical protein F7725_008299 [Dissostichus mawsoni]